MERPHWDDQFSESESERNARLRAKRLAKLDPRDPDLSRPGIFRDHNCYRCDSGKKPCVVGNPSRCEYPHARND
ncbi:MAG: hypothetical protein WC026_17085 [Hyphomicrobium sp.]|uniref:hypothetical protein n=1 Tax=Hyphomicrobium sp. TaxID=82 RepID=UPI00356231B6